MYLRVTDITTLIQQRTLVLHIVALLDVSLEHNESRRKSRFVPVGTYKCRWGHNDIRA